MICPNCNTVMVGGRVRVNSSFGSFPRLEWVGEHEFKSMGGWKDLFSARNHRRANLFDVANEGYYCPTCNQIMAVFQAQLKSTD